MKQIKIPLAGVIGAPIVHSKSPQIHNHWLKNYGIKGHYIPMDVSPENLRDVLINLPKMGFVGANVTLPHKEAVLDIADEITDHAKMIGAANTLVFSENGKIHADNTDGYGFIQNLKSGAGEWIPDSGPAVVLGAGGAARAVIVYLLESGVPKIYLANRTRERAEKLADEFGSRIIVIDWSETDDVLNEAHLAVNTTSLGMLGKPELNISLKGLKKSTIVTDLVYNPLQTQFLKAAKERGCVTVDGLGMLLHQAVPGFERWFGKRPIVDSATRAVALE